MSIIEAVNLGVIQGITEWLPISSSGHLALYEKIANVQDTPLLFNVLLHFASLAVILVVFRERIKEILHSPRYLTNIILGSIPIAIGGFFVRDLIESSFSNTRLVSGALIVTGFLLFLTRFTREKTTRVTPLQSIAIGIMQAVALVPGISRSGATISTGMLSGISREKSAEFSFILAIPAILGATLFESLRIKSVDRNLIIPLLAGMIISFVVGYFSLKLLLKAVRRGQLFWFSFYCIALGIVSGIVIE